MYPLLRITVLPLFATLLWMNSTVLAAPPPQPAPDAHAAHDHRSHDPSTRPILRRPEIARESPAQHWHKSASDCDLPALATMTDGQRIAAVRASTPQCLYGLFSISGALAGSLFAEARMVAMAQAMQSLADAYPGDNRDAILQVVLYLRAGYFVQFYNQADVGAYGPALHAASGAALDAFVGSPHFLAASAAHAGVLPEVVTLIDSAGHNTRQLPALIALLSAFDAERAQVWGLRAATNGVFTVLFRGHYLDDFALAVQADRSILHTLAAFIADNAALADGPNEYLLGNAASEMSRFLQYGDPLKSELRPLVRDVLQQWSMLGPGAAIWVGTADMALWYDAAWCSWYGICDFHAELEAAVLPILHECSDSLVLRAQSLTPAQIDATCSELAPLEVEFHERLATGRVPVADDYNTRLQMIVFASSRAYQTYSGVLFGNDTNNGGIYLEGNPANPANVPRFIAYVAEWLQPEFRIWNLRHEYVHYLDGRYNMYGTFAQTMSAPTVWWLEGLAEYLAFGDDNPAAVAIAGNRSHALSALFRTSYSHGSERVYRWGYLAVRYMFERRRDSVDAMLGLWRPGQYPQYTALLDQLGAGFDADFHDWLGCLAGETAGCVAREPLVFADGFEIAPEVPLVACTSADARELGAACYREGLSSSHESLYLWLDVPSGAHDLRIVTEGGSGGHALYLKHGGWPSVDDHDQGGSGPLTLSIDGALAPGHYFLMLRPQPGFQGLRISSRYRLP